VRYWLIILILVLVPPALHAFSHVEKPLAMVYRGPASCEGCPEAVARVLETSKYVFDVAYVGPGEAMQLDAASLERATLYAQPGGPDGVDEAVEAIGDEAIEAVRKFVSGGGRYLGFCMGAFLADDPGFDLIEGRTLAYTERPHAKVKNDEDTVTPVIWRGKKRLMYFQSGAAIQYKSSEKSAEVLARYPNGDIAAAVSDFGRGRVGIVGPHPEADKSWYDSEDLRYPGATDDLAQDLLETTMERR